MSQFVGPVPSQILDPQLDWHSETIEMRVWMNQMRNAVISGGGGLGVNTQDEGIAVDTPASTLNFVGAGVTATGGAGTTTVTIPGGSGAPSAPANSVQYNNAGAFGGNAGLLFDPAVQTLSMTGAAPRLKIDTGTAGEANRFWIYNSVVNDNTRLGIMPNGAGTNALTRCINNSSPAAAATMGQFGQVNTVTIVDANTLNAGAQGTIELRISGAAALVVDILKDVQLRAGLSTPVLAKTGNYTLLQTDHVIFADCSAGSITMTLPLANVAGATFSPCFRIKRIDSSGNIVTVAAAGADTIDGTATRVLGPLEAADLESDGVSKWGLIINIPSAGAAGAQFNWGKFIAGRHVWPGG